MMLQSVLLVALRAGGVSINGVCWFPATMQAILINIRQLGGLSSAKTPSFKP